MPSLAAIELSSQDHINTNLFIIEQQLVQIAQAGIDLVVLPENMACFAAGQQHKIAEQFDYIKQQLQFFAQRYQLWIVAGTLPCPYRPNGQIIPDGRVRSASLLVDPSGSIVARYDKIHLFDAQIPDGTGLYQESLTFEAGTEVVCAQTPFGGLGLMICYDLRFPELALTLRQKGAHILCAPAAFTYHTGQRHWELLLRARAIDTQCVVIGAAQRGWHGTRQTWGHSTIVQFDGESLDTYTQSGAGYISACYDQQKLLAYRQAMPLMDHRHLPLLI